MEELYPLNKKMCVGRATETKSWGTSCLQQAVKDMAYRVIAVGVTWATGGGMAIYHMWVFSGILFLRKVNMPRVWRWEGGRLRDHIVTCSPCLDQLIVYNELQWNLAVYKATI